MRLGPGADASLGLQADLARFVQRASRRVLIDPLAARLAIDARRAGVDDSLRREREMIEDVLQAVHVNGPHRGPCGTVEPHAVKNPIGRRQLAQRIGPEHVGDNRLDPSPAMHRGPTRRSDRAEDAPTVSGGARHPTAGPGSRSR